LTYGLFCGVGTGIVYVGIVGLMLKWFPDRRGLATGVVAAGYGFGAMATTFPIDAMIRTDGFQHTLAVFGCILGVVGALAGLLIRPPANDRSPRIETFAGASTNVSNGSKAGIREADERAAFFR
jgi:MFS family permease